MPDALNAAYHAATQSVIKPTQQRIVANWENLMRHGLDQIAIQTFTDASAPAAIAMQTSVANLTSAFLANRTGDKPLVPDPSIVLGRNETPSSRQDAATQWASTYARPFVQARSLVKDGMTLDDAISKTANRIALMLSTDAQISKLRQAHESLRHYGATEYKRVNHPEASETGTCALCLLASTQVYYVEDLLPIHTGCQCDVDLIQPGDISRINGRRYVGLSTLQIPEELMRIGPRADPNSDRTIIASYLQDMDKRQFHVITEAWAKTVEVQDHPELGRVLEMRSKVLNYDPNLDHPVHTVVIDTEKQPKLDVSQPIALSDLTDDEFGSGVQTIDDNINTAWSSITFDEDKFEMREGAQDAQWHGYQGMTQAEFDALINGDLDPVAMYQLYGKELVARAAWEDTTDQELWRGVNLTKADAQNLSEWVGKEISLPLSSFTDDSVAAAGFATKQGWVSEDIPAHGVPVVLKLEPGARAATIGGIDDFTGEKVSFGRFKVVNVELPAKGAKIGGMEPWDTGRYPMPITVTIEQTSMVEARAEIAMSSAKTTAIPDISFVESKPLPNTYEGLRAWWEKEDAAIAAADRAAEEVPKGLLAGPITEDTSLLDTVDIFNQHWPDIWVQDFDTDLLLKDPDKALIARDFLRGVDDVLMRFPEAAEHLSSVQVAPTYNARAFASTTPSAEPGKVLSVTFNERWIKKPAKYVEEMDDAVRARWFHDYGVSPGYATAAHEMGHTVDMVAGWETIQTNPEEILLGLRDLYETQTGRKVPFDPLEYLTEKQMDERFHFIDWLNENLSGYSFVDHPEVHILELPEIDPVEAVAESFYDVFVNGDNATDGSKWLFNWLLNSAADAGKITDERVAALRFLLPGE